MVLARSLAGAVLVTLGFLPAFAPAAELREFTLVIQNHRFEPAELKVPARQKIKLIVDNRDASAEEFESHELNREKVIPARSKAPVFIGPLEPGRYPFFGEFNPKTAQGVIVAE